jgi:hypothetical protein
MTTAINSIISFAAQTSTTFGTWSTQPFMVPMTASEGAGQVIGEATLSMPYGSIRNITPDYAGTAGVLTFTGSNFAGQWVRLLYEVSTGSVTIGTGGATTKKYDPFWWGIIDKQQTFSEGGTTANVGQQMWLCSALPAVLDRIVISSGREAMNGVVSAPSNPGYLPKFNSVPAGDRSNSASGDPAWGGTNPYVHDRMSSTRTYWGALDALQYCFAIAERYDSFPGLGFAGAPTLIHWTFSDPDNCLSYRLPEMDFNGMTLLQILNNIAGYRRGLTWKVTSVNETVSPAVATITIYSISATALSGGIPVGTGTTYVLPASSHTATVDLSQSVFISDVMVTEDYSSVYNYIEVSGGRPWVAMTLCYDPTDSSGTTHSLCKGWASSQETTWASGTAFDSTTEMVWRRFALPLSWNGRQYNSSGSTGLRNFQEFDASGTASGTTWGYTGGRHRAEGDTYQKETISTWDLNLTRETPDSMAYAGLSIGPRQTPTLMFSVGASGTTFIQANLPGSPLQLQVEIQGTDGPAVFVGSSQADSYKVYSFANYAQMLVTVGMREPKPFKVSWFSNSGATKDTYTQLMLNYPQLEWWQVLDQTVTGVNQSTGALILQSGDKPLRDDRFKANHILALLKAYYSQPARTITWKHNGYFDILPALWQPGTLITTATIDSTSKTINAVVTRRSWDFTFDGFGTTYTTERIVPDVEAIL